MYIYSVFLIQYLEDMKTIKSCCFCITVLLSYECEFYKVKCYIRAKMCIKNISSCDI